MELNRSEFSYSNSIFEDDIVYIIDVIDLEIISLHKIKNNIKKFTYIECKKGNLTLLKFNSLIDEMSRMNNEIFFLEQTKLQYIRIKENI